MDVFQILCQSPAVFRKVVSWIQCCLLFLINDLPEVINVCFKMFADDSKMYGRVTTIDQAGLVQNSINNAVKWAEDWQMFF